MRRFVLSLSCVALGCGGVVADPFSTNVNRDDAGDAAVVTIDARAEAAFETSLAVDTGGITYDAGSVTCPAQTLPDPVCPIATCGNGHRDTCSVCTPGSCWGGDPPGPAPACDAGVTCTTNAEACDGDDLNGVTCAALGFAGGTLRCGAWCDFDTTGCDPCATGPHVIGCERAPVDGKGASWLSVAATDNEIGV
ncbi:MAG: hypothetical protein ACHREM_28255, partial [Polyangiales bacterium]